MKGISNNGFWLDDSLENHHFDQDLCKGLIEFFREEKQAKSLYDFGCGHGLYTHHLTEEVGLNVHAFDGNPNTPQISNGIGIVLDLSQPVNLDKHDWVLSLEVGEHIPKDFEQIFINNIHESNSQGVILSWAIPGQGGNGHYNEQSNEYIKGIFNKLGYVNDLDAEKKLRESSSHWWFKNTIMVFRRK